MSFLPITQTAHGFSQFDWLYYSGAPYALAKADAEATIAWGCIGRVIDANSFELVLEGIIAVAAHGVGSAGDTLFLSQASAGAEVTTQPVSGISQPVGQVLDADHLYVHIMGAEWI